MMHFLRQHWFDLAAVLAALLLGWLAIAHAELSAYQLLMWLSLASLLLHQVEEYRVVGTFPGMLNHVMYQSAQPDRYPLNTNTALIVNVGVGWTSYALAAIVAEHAIWLGMATVLVSAGNTVAHTVVFNLRGKSLFNPGMATSLVLFVPVVGAFFWLIHTQQLVQVHDYLIGVSLGVALNVVGILKLIDWMKDPHTPYVFPQRCLLPADRSRQR